MPGRKAKFFLILLRTFQGFSYLGHLWFHFLFLKSTQSTSFLSSFPLLNFAVFYIEALLLIQAFRTMNHSHTKPFPQWTFATANLFNADHFLSKPLLHWAFSTFSYTFPHWTHPFPSSGIISQDIWQPKVLRMPIRETMLQDGNNIKLIVTISSSLYRILLVRRVRHCLLRAHAYTIIIIFLFGLLLPKSLLILIFC